MSIDPASARKRLIDRQTELQNHSHISKQARDTVTLDQQSVGRLTRMDAMQQQAMAAATKRARDGELLRIKAALKRLDMGDYGYCLQCGNEIAEKRLDVDPGAPLCINCSGRQ